MNKRFLCMWVTIFIAITEGVSWGAVAISGLSGLATNGEVITVSGTGFGTKHEPDRYDYFDEYGSDWSCNTADGSCTNPPATTGMSWQKLIFGSMTPCTGDCYMMKITGNAFLNINQQATNYSTGRAYVEWPEYYTGGAGGLPNSSLRNTFAECNEIFYTYYVYYDPAWPDSPYLCVQDKNAVFWLKNSGHKVTGSWAVRSFKQHYELSTEAVGSPVETNMNCPTCLDTSRTQRATEVYFENLGVGKWIEIKLHIKLNTWTGGNPNQDGIVQVWINGTQIVNESSVVLSNTDGDTFYYSQVRSNWTGDTVSQLSFGPGQEFLVAYDDILMNFSGVDPTGGVFPGVACVYLSNQPTWGGGPSDRLNGDSAFVRQKVGGTDAADYGFRSWNDAQLKFQVNLGSLDVSKGVYLYVTNWSGETNSAGTKLEGGIPPAGPTGVKLRQK